MEGMYYTKDHEWVKPEGDSFVIGITDHAQEALGEITYVELPELEKEYKAHDELGVVESSKAASDVYSPVAGKVVQVNTDLDAEPDLINKDCYNRGWICKIETTDLQQLEGLMNEQAYLKYLKQSEE